jgi:hypothetical protein
VEGHRHERALDRVATPLRIAPAVDDASVINPTPEVADRGQDHDRSSEETRAEGNVPTMRAVVGRSARKSTGSVAVAVVPIESNVCEDGVPVGIPIAACTTANAMTTATDIVAHTSSARRNLDRMKSNLSLVVIRRK